MFHRRGNISPVRLFGWLGNRARTSVRWVSGDTSHLTATEADRLLRLVVNLGLGRRKVRRHGCRDEHGAVDVDERAASSPFDLQCAN
jgi:hypothetical protein